MRPFRWWLARLIAPAPIMRDPFPDEDGAFVILRQDGSVVTLRSDRFRMRSTNRLDLHDFGSQSLPQPRRARSFTRFVGTIAR